VKNFRVLIGVVVVLISLELLFEWLPPIHLLLEFDEKILKLLISDVHDNTNVKTMKEFLHIIIVYITKNTTTEQRNDN
jgi:hypothetical protein